MKGFYIMKKLIALVLSVCTGAIFSLPALSYNVVNLPASMTMADALGIFSADEILSATITNAEEDMYITLNKDQINEFYYSSCNMMLERTINPTPFRGTAINLTTATDTMSYNVGSGVQIGLYGKDNYICYKPSGKNEVDLTYIDTLYKDSTNKKSGAQINRATTHDFLNLPTALWAIEPVEQAARNSLLPYEITKKYNQYVSREDFCKLIGRVLTVHSGYAGLDSFVRERNGAYLKNVFSDCEGKDESIDMLYSLKIINGKSETTFDPEGALTREEAATVITKTAELFTHISAQNTLSYSDNRSISDWAYYYVRWVTQSGLMTGSDQNKFDPKSYYTVEQAITTVNRLFNYLEEL